MMWGVVFCGDLLLMSDVIDETIWILQISIASLQRLMSCGEKDTFGGWICMNLLGKSHHHVAIMTAQITCLSLSLPGVVKITLDDANLIADAELVFDTKLVWVCQNGQGLYPHHGQQLEVAVYHPRHHHTVAASRSSRLVTASGRWEWRLTYQDTVRTKIGDMDLLERAKRSRKKSAKLDGVLVGFAGSFWGENGSALRSG